MFVDLVTAVTIIKHLKTSLAVSGLVVIMTAAGVQALAVSDDLKVRLNEQEMVEGWSRRRRTRKPGGPRSTSQRP